MMGRTGNNYFCDSSDALDSMDQYVMTLLIYDPCNQSNNVGKHVRANELQKMFRSAYISLHLNFSKEKRLAIMFDMKKIIL